MLKYNITNAVESPYIEVTARYLHFSRSAMQETGCILGFSLRLENSHILELTTFAVNICNCIKLFLKQG
jgi:hypothetical protein